MAIRNIRSENIDWEAMHNILQKQAFQNQEVYKKQLEKFKNINVQLLNACKYTKTLLSDDIGQTTHAIALLEDAIEVAT